MKWIAVGILAFGAFHWDPFPDATAYRVYWSDSPTTFVDCASVEVEQAVVRDDLTEPVIPTPDPGGIFFIVVTAVKEDGTETSAGIGREIVPCGVP